MAVSIPCVKFLFVMPVINIPVDRARDEAKKFVVFHIFIVLAVLTTLSEPFLVSYPPHGLARELQVIILAISTLLFFVGIFIVMSFYPKNVNRSLTGKFLDMFDGEVILEVFCLAWGWVFIFNYPGVAALRCVRVFRLLWYFELFIEFEDKDQEKGDEKDDKSEDDNLLAKQPYSPIRAINLSIEYIEKLGKELMSSSTGGGLMVLLTFFYVTYVIAVVFWVDKAHLLTPEGVPCEKLKTCFLVMLRLSFYDGSGFDYLTAVYKERHRTSGGYATLLILYMIVGAIVLLNGLIGIFGNAFSKNKDIFASDEEEDINTPKPEGEEYVGIS